MKIENIYKNDNNLYQSPEWFEFQKSYGRNIVEFSNCSGLELNLPFGKKAIWVQKAPNKITKEVISEFVDSGADFVRIEPAKLCDSDKNDYDLKYVTDSSLLCGQKSPKATQLIDISLEEDEILKNMKSKTRYNIRLSERKGVKVKVENNSDILYELLSETEKRQKGYHTHPKDYYEKLLSTNFSKVFIAYNGKKPIAAILVSIYGEIATYLHGGFSNADKNLMAPFLCHMEAMKYAKKHGCTIYDMWGVAETDDPNDPWVGITRFKQGFGGEKVVFPGSYDYIGNKFWYNTLTLLARVRKVVR